MGWTKAGTGDKTKYEILPTAYQGHFTVSNGAKFQLVGVSVLGVLGGNTAGGGVNAGSNTFFASQDVVFSAIFSGAINAQGAAKVIVR